MASLSPLGQGASPGSVQVVVDDPEHMVLLGLLLRGVLADKLVDAEADSRARALRGELAIQAGEMQVRLRFEGTTIQITRQAEGRPTARVTGNIKALLDVIAGGPVVRPLIDRSIRPRGNLVFLLRVLLLLRPTTQRPTSS